MLKSSYIIAEISSAHDGSIDDLRSLADASINAGADAVKFQIFKRSNLLSPNNPMYDEFAKIEINKKDWISILDDYIKKNIDVIVEVFDHQSLDIISGRKCDLKIPSASISDKQYIKNLLHFKGKVYLAVGGSKIEEITNSIKLLNKIKNLVLVVGFQNFPTKLEDSNLAQISYLKDKFNLPIAYADHIDAEDSLMRFIIPALAINCGAEYIEKHITLNRSLKGRDYYSALNPDEFKVFVDNIKSLQRCYGDPLLMGKSDAEIKYKRFSKKYAIANKVIEAGSKCRFEDFKFLRTGVIGINENEFKDFENKTIIKKIEVNELLLPKNFKNV
tara:strand:+ start:648 stop:1640 length:993 start_codon:yes stop_codon:yes gene_type:complete